MIFANHVTCNCEESCGKEQQKERYSRQQAEGNARETEQYRQKANELHEEVAKLRITHDELPIEEKNLSDKINDGELRFNRRLESTFLRTLPGAIPRKSPTDELTDSFIVFCTGVNQKQRRLQKEIDDLLFKLRQYKGILGLKMETTGASNLSMAFQYINRNDRAREYRVVVSITNGRFKGRLLTGDSHPSVQEECRYEFFSNRLSLTVVVECSHPIPELDDLNSRLISGNDLRAFVIDLRTAFVNFANTSE